MATCSSGIFWTSPAAGFRCKARMISLRSSIDINKAADRRFVSLPSFSGAGYVVGGRVPVVCGWEERSNNFFCRRFGLGDSFSVSFFCIDGQYSCVLLWVVCGLPDNVKSVNYNMAIVRRSRGDLTSGLGFRLLVLLSLLCFSGGCVGDSVTSGDGAVRFAYQLVEMPGWILAPTLFGGSAPLRGSSSSDVPGDLNLEASDLLEFDDGMVDDHRFQPGRSASTKQVNIGVLYKTASKISVSSSKRRSASSNELWPPALRNTGRCLQGPDCNFLLSQGCSCKLWAVITIFM